jgi:hypothetical protein
MRQAGTSVRRRPWLNPARATGWPSGSRGNRRGMGRRGRGVISTSRAQSESMSLRVGVLWPWPVDVRRMPVTAEAASGRGLGPEWLEGRKRRSEGWRGCPLRWLKVQWAAVSTTLGVIRVPVQAPPMRRCTSPIACQGQRRESTGMRSSAPKMLRGWGWPAALLGKRDSWVARARRRGIRRCLRERLRAMEERSCLMDGGDQSDETRPGRVFPGMTMITTMPLQICGTTHVAQH